MTLEALRESLGYVYSINQQWHLAFPIIYEVLYMYSIICLRELCCLLSPVVDKL